MQKYIANSLFSNCLLTLTSQEQKGIVLKEVISFSFFFFFFCFCFILCTCCSTLKFSQWKFGPLSLKKVSCGFYSNCQVWSIIPFVASDTNTARETFSATICSLTVLPSVAYSGLQLSFLFIWEGLDNKLYIVMTGRGKEDCHPYKGLILQLCGPEFNAFATWPHNGYFRSTLFQSVSASLKKWVTGTNFIVYVSHSLSAWVREYD